MTSNKRPYDPVAYLDELIVTHPQKTLVRRLMLVAMKRKKIKLAEVTRMQLIGLHDQVVDDVHRAAGKPLRSVSRALSTRRTVRGYPPKHRPGH